MQVPLWNTSLPPIGRTNLTLLEVVRNENDETRFVVVRGKLRPPSPLEVIAAFAIDRRDADGFKGLDAGDQFEACGNDGNGFAMFAMVGSTLPITVGKDCDGIEETLRNALKKHLKPAVAGGPE